MKRLDLMLVDRGLCTTQEQAQAFILAGEVWSAERRLEKAGEKFPEDLPIEVRSNTPPFVSRAGEKLEHALAEFGLEVKGRVCVDIGASTGGFTDCLLKRGAEKVFSVDVGYGQLYASLRNDPRVVNLERVNARHLTRAALVEKDAAAERISLAVVDVSFISLKTVIAPLLGELPSVKDWVCLFKPQFEVDRKFVEKGGLVRDEGAITSAMDSFRGFLTAHGLVHRAGPTASPLAGKKSGNLEYLLHYEK